MVRVQIEVESGAGRFLVSVRAANVGRALRLAGAGTPGIRARVVHAASTGTSSFGPRRAEPAPLGSAA